MQAPPWAPLLRPSSAHHPQLMRWGAMLAPVASVSLIDVRAGAALLPGGRVAARGRVGALLLANLQLWQLGRTPATMPRFWVRERDGYIR